MRFGVPLFLVIVSATAATVGPILAEVKPFAPVGGEFVGIRHRSIFGSREPGVPREVVAMA